MLSNGPDKKERTKRTEEVEMQKRCYLYYCLCYTSDWVKHQILRNLRKGACILIPCFLTNIKSLLSLSNRNIL